MAETEDLAEADQSHEVRGHMYSSGGRELWAREVGDRDLGMGERDQLMSPTVNPNRESSYLPEGVLPVRDTGAAYGVADPKNQQMNLCPEEDNISHKVPSLRERLMPRKMHGQDPATGQGLHDEDQGFINIHLELFEESQRPEAAETGPGAHERQDSVVSASISGLHKADQSHELGGHMYGSGGRELGAREVSDHDHGLEDRHHVMLETQSPSQEVGGQLKEAAKMGNKQAATMLAKQLINVRKQKTGTSKVGIRFRH